MLQAKNIMFIPSALVFLKDGPQVASNEMKKNGISSVFVIDNRRVLQGLVTIDVFQLNLDTASAARMIMGGQTWRAITLIGKRSFVIIY